MRSLVQLVVIASVVAAVPGSPAVAGNPRKLPTLPEARDHFDRGNRFYNIGAFDDAIVEYKAGALLEPAPVFDYNLGQSYRQLGKYRESLWHYDRFLNNAQPTGPMRDAVIAFMAEMRAQLANKALTMPPTDPAPSRGDAQPAESGGRSTGEVNRDRPSASSTAPVESTHTRDWLGLSLTGAGVIGLGTAGYLFLRYSTLNDQAANAPGQFDGQRLATAAHTRLIAGAITATGAAALIIGGIVKLASHHDEPTRAVTWGVAPTGDGVSVFGQF